MLSGLVAQPILAEADKRETEYDWLGACECYKKALDSVPEEDLANQGEIFERSGYAFYRAAMQAETRDEFRDRIGRAIDDYAQSIQMHGKTIDPGEEARSLRCRAMASHLSFWLASDASEKKKHLDESWRLTKEALRSFEKAGDPLERGRTYNLLAASAHHLVLLDTDFDSVENIARELAEEGEKAINSLSLIGDRSELATAYVTTIGALGGFSYLLPDIEAREKHIPKIREYWHIANESSEEAVLIAASRPGGGNAIEDPEELFAFLEKALHLCRKTKDKLYIGVTLGFLAYETFWKSLDTEDPEERVGLFEKARQYGDEAEDQYSLIGFNAQHGGRWPGPPYVEYYWQLACWESDLARRRNLLERALEAAPILLQCAETSGYPAYTNTAHHVISKVLESLAKLETNRGEKRKLLEKALEHRNASISGMPVAQRFMFWNHGVFQNHLADIKSALAELATNPESKKGMLGDAVLAKKTGAELCLKDIQSWEKTGPSPGRRTVLGGYQSDYGNLLVRFYRLNEDRTILEQAAEAFENAAESFRKDGLASLTAECHWRCALAYDSLSKHMESSGKFELASESYKEAADKIPRLSGFYKDYALYMEAWSEIEKARYHHSRQEYGSAEEDYSKAADLHRTTKQWGYLGSNYQAWSSVEKAEDLSRREQNEEAIQAFKQASALFRDAKNSLQAELVKVESQDEREMTTELVKAADLRADYCKARIILEDAKLLNRKGDHYSSSEKYGLAAETFEKIARVLESELSRQEFKPIVALSRAWQIMTRAEAQASPLLYSEASRLFEEAKQFSPTESATMLASGHSHFCKALEAGTRFADTRETPLYAPAISHLESAANYYVKAGFQNGSEYAKATGLLFDAYAQADKAKKEEDTEKKARLYMMTEKILQACADSYSKAQYPGKTQEVLVLLDKVKQERDLAVSLLEILRAPSIISTTSSFATPTPAHERPIGLERFEHADVQANLICRRRELRVGEVLDVEIEIINAGNGPARLVKVEELVPEGFEITEKPERYHVEDSYLNMKGKQLNSLKTEEVKLILTPKTKGEFILRPRILYLDEDGRYKSHETAPIELTVRELETSGLPESERRLAAIMFTDMVGYTALSEKNEAIALELLAEHRKIVRPLYPRHDGREIKTMGDAFLVEFESALEAVKCALEIQKLLHDRNAISPTDRQILVRVGVHLGDVIHSGKDVYGDAVNVASRIEPLADPGGVCVSGQVYESVKKTMSCEFESLGLREMKNVADSVMVYKILLPWQEPYISISVHNKPLPANKNIGPSPS